MLKCIICNEINNNSFFLSFKKQKQRPLKRKRAGTLNMFFIWFGLQLRWPWNHGPFKPLYAGVWKKTPPCPSGSHIVMFPFCVFLKSGISSSNNRKTTQDAKMDVPLKRSFFLKLKNKGSYSFYFSAKVHNFHQTKKFCGGFQMYTSCLCIVLRRCLTPPPVMQQRYVLFFLSRSECVIGSVFTCTYVSITSRRSHHVRCVAIL